MIECYTAMCPHHGLHRGWEEPLCPEPECRFPVLVPGAWFSYYDIEGRLHVVPPF